MMRNSKLPHISRIISAIILWGTLGIAIYCNGIYLQKVKTAYSDKIFSILTHPFDPAPHMALATISQENATVDIATTELALANDLETKESGVLGVTTAQSKTVEDRISYWEQVVSTHPDYRDAYIQLAALTYKQGNLTKTKEYLTRASGLDPNGSVNALLEFISKL